MRDSELFLNAGVLVIGAFLILVFMGPLFLMAAAVITGVVSLGVMVG
jgi:hypothetical protein